MRQHHTTLHLIRMTGE